MSYKAQAVLLVTGLFNVWLVLHFFAYLMASYFGAS